MIHGFIHRELGIERKTFLVFHFQFLMYFNSSAKPAMRAFLLVFPFHVVSNNEMLTTV